MTTVGSEPATKIQSNISRH